MRTVIVLSAIVFTLILIEAIPTPGNTKYEQEAKLRCIKTCQKLKGTTASFDEDTLTCKCHITATFHVLIKAVPENIDDEEYKLHCNKVCQDLNSTVIFDKDTLTCKCDITEELYAADTTLLNLTDESIPSTTHNSREKRRIPRSDSILGQQLAPVFPINRPLIGQGQLKPPLIPQPKFPLVGPAKPLPLLPANPPRLLPPNRPLIIQPNRPLIVQPNRPLIVQPKVPLIVQPNLPLKPNALPNAQPHALHTLTDIRQRVSNLARNPGARNSQAQINELRASLRNLSKQVNILTPEQRARIAASRARIAQQRNARINGLRTAGAGRLLPKPGLLGSAANNTSDKMPSQRGEQKQNQMSNTSNEEANQSDESSEDDDVNSKPQKPIITQPKELIED